MARKNSSSETVQSAGIGNKVGSDSQAARSVGGKGDFGVRENDVVERQYTSANTRASDPGAAHPHAGEDEGRVAGVGGDAVGVGSSSGGDLDTDIIGVGNGGSGIAASPANEPPGPDDATGTSADFASGPPTHNRKGPKAGKVEGSTVDRTGGDVETTASGRGADAVSSPPRPNPDELDDSFAGEISSGEAAGENG